MFVNVEIEEIIIIVAEHFNSIRTYIREEINRKFVHKVINGVGLGVCIYDILDISDPFVNQSEGSARVRVRFRLTVFRPLIDEVITGKVIASTSDGIQVSLDFTTAILIPNSNLPDSTLL